MFSVAQWQRALCSPSSENNRLSDTVHQKVELYWEQLTADSPQLNCLSLNMVFSGGGTSSSTLSESIGTGAVDIFK